MDKKYYIARKLRHSQTSQELKLWNLLRNRKFNGYKFVRQYPIGDYIVDFACRKKKIIIELDGGQHNTPEIIEYDKNRSKYIEQKGYKILRVWNNDIDNNLEGVYEWLLKFFE